MNYARLTLVCNIATLVLIIVSCVFYALAARYQRQINDLTNRRLKALEDERP